MKRVGRRPRASTLLDRTAELNWEIASVEFLLETLVNTENFHIEVHVENFNGRAASSTSLLDNLEASVYRHFGLGRCTDSRVQAGVYAVMVCLTGRNFGVLETLGWPWGFSPKVHASSSSLLPNSSSLSPPSRLSFSRAAKDRSWHRPRHAVNIHHVFNSRNSSRETGRHDLILAIGVAISRRSTLANVVRAFALKRARVVGISFLLLLRASTEQKLNHVIVDSSVAPYSG